MIRLEDMTEQEGIDLMCMMLDSINKDLEGLNHKLNGSFTYHELLEKARDIYSSQNFSVKDKKYVFDKIKEMESHNMNSEDSYMKALKINEEIINYISDIERGEIKLISKL